MFVFFRGYASANGPAFHLHSDIIMPYFSKYGSEEQKQKYIPDMTAGKKISAIAMTEPDAGRYIKTFSFYFIELPPFLLFSYCFATKAIFKGSNHLRGRMGQITFLTDPRCSSPTGG
jgi:hypothetical protein